jgi:hypothetical protein
VQVSTDGGKTWKSILDVKAVSTGETWSKIEVNLTKYCGQGQNVLIGFLFDTYDNVMNAGRGWFIDDVKVEGIRSPYLLWDSYYASDPYIYPNASCGGYRIHTERIDNETGEGDVYAYANEAWYGVGESGSYAKVGSQHEKDYESIWWDNNTGFAFANVTIHSGDLDKWPTWLGVAEIDVYIYVIEYNLTYTYDPTIGAWVWDWVFFQLYSGFEKITGIGTMSNLQIYPFAMVNWTSGEYNHSYKSYVGVGAYAKASGYAPAYWLPGGWRTNPLRASAEASFTVNYIKWYVG